MSEVERQYPLKTKVLAAKIKERGYTIALLAQKLDLNVSTVRRWLKGGKAYMRNIEPLAKAISVSPQELIEGLVEQDRIQIRIQVYLPTNLVTLETFRKEQPFFLDALKHLLNASDEIKVNSITEEE